MKILKTSLLIALVAVAFSCSNNKKKVVTPAKPVVKEVKKPEEVVEKKPSLVFTVQIGAYKKENPTLSGINDIQLFHEDDLIKYRLGNFTSYEEATAYKRSILNRYSDAFVQALKDGKRLQISEAIQMQQQQ